MPAMLEIVAMTASQAAEPATQVVSLAATAAARGSGVGVDLWLIADAADAWPVAAALASAHVAFRGHGAALFVAHRLARLFVLGLGAIADRDDGVAEAALVRSPFFALSIEDLVAALILKDTAGDPRRQRVNEAREIVNTLRRRRHRATPGCTARELLRRTRLGAALAELPNAVHEQAVIDALIASIEAIAWRDELDFDGVAARLRNWLGQAAGLELPITIGPGAWHIVPASLDLSLACERAIVGCVGPGADGWNCRRTADGDLELTYGAQPLRAQVSSRLIVGVRGDLQSARQRLRERWPGVL